MFFEDHIKFCEIFVQFPCDCMVKELICKTALFFNLFLGGLQTDFITSLFSVVVDSKAVLGGVGVEGGGGTGQCKEGGRY